MTTTVTTGRLTVPGATLHYEVRGQGPLLLLIPGGAGGAAAFEGIAGDLAAAYTVATYDPRGISRSALDDPDAEQSVAEHADDAYRLLAELSPGEPARVFGLSSGAITALHLLTTHPDRVLRAVVHEPPVVEVLPDAATHRAMVARVQETFRTRGLMPAMAEFAAGLKKPGATALPQPELKLPPQAAARAEQTMANLPYFLGRVVPRFMAYVPDTERLAALADRLVLAGGEDSRGEVAYLPAAFLAERFGTELVHFPGGHTGSTTHAAAFAARLAETFRA
ncbi:alpha/beta hydrolase [Streptomyces sp. NRRL F-4489]|uniref:alpha/beta fold hydrolase n=1 Tax=Streptomyces sp. NRRL F-4489 TaxID=1609095 RepID=UPI00074A6AB0|nr:alpha/beta hydrolase [Streptomyces sp. NRRL F-4489]KUL46087.1 alpha/beta hydrolase [Streptomyces sp. NRRL F-4489]